MTLWRCLLTTSTNRPAMINWIKSPPVWSVSVWGHHWFVKHPALRHNGLFGVESSIFFIRISPFAQICSFLHLAKVSMMHNASKHSGKTVLYNHVLAPLLLHLHNWACAYWTCKLCAVALAEARADRCWSMSLVGVYDVLKFYLWCTQLSFRENTDYKPVLNGKQQGQNV